MMERLTKYGNTSHENGVCCTHFNSKECHEVAGNCAMGCKWEEEAWSKLAHYEDLEEQGLLLKLPCKVGDKCYIPSANFKRVLEVYVISISKGKENLWVRCGNGLMYLWNEEIFATKEEAEAKLKEYDGVKTE